VPPTAKLLVSQVTRTLVMSVAAIVPVPLVMLQTCTGDCGCWATVTL
jgi:hypothetical protein